MKDRKQEILFQRHVQFYSRILQFISLFRQFSSFFFNTSLAIVLFDTKYWTSKPNIMKTSITLLLVMISLKGYSQYDSTYTQAYL